MAEPRFRYVEGFTRAARLAFDVRDWYAGAFRPDAVRLVKLPDGKTEPVQAVVRPSGQLTFLAEPLAPADRNWPFAGAVELVCPVTPAGLRVFFGRVRSPNGGPLRRVTLAGTAFRLTVSGDGYAPAVLPRVELAAELPDRPPPPPQVVRIDLMPGPERPPGVTEIAGGVFQPDGDPVKATVRVLDAAGAELVKAATDAAGLWRAELKPAGANPVDVRLEVQNGGAAVQVGPVTVRPGRANRVPQTVLRGVVRRANGTPVDGAVVTLPPLAGRTRTRPDGSWVFYPPLADPLSGSVNATVTVDGAAALPVVVVRGEGNTVPAIQV